MKTFPIILALLLTLVMTASCGILSSPEEVQTSPGRDSADSTSFGTVPVPAPAIAPRPATIPEATKIAAADTQAGSNDDQRMIVRTGNLSIVVDDVSFALDRIARLATTQQGYVVSSQTYRDGERLRGTISIRVPVDQFDIAMRDIASLAIDVPNRTTTAKDVTEEYVDLKAKIQTLEATEAQLLRLMEKATKMEEILAIQRELTTVRTNIEQTKARMIYLERTTSTSVISVQLEQSKLDAKFTASSATIKEGEDVSFRPTVGGGFTPYSYLWDFGDGSTSTETAPTHAYSASGKFTVRLKVTDNRANSVTVERKDLLNVLPGWNVGEVAKGAGDALVGFGRTLLTILIYLGYLAPVWIIIGVAVWWWRRSRRNRGGGGQGPTAPATGADGSPSAGGRGTSAVNPGVSPQSRLVTALLAFFVGIFGAHRFYTGKNGQAAGMLALGVIGLATVQWYFGWVFIAAVVIWGWVDFGLTCGGKLRDGGGRPVVDWAA
jgi:PKD repeat protein